MTSGRDVTSDPFSRAATVPQIEATSLISHGVARPGFRKAAATDRNIPTGHDGTASIARAKALTGHDETASTARAGKDLTARAEKVSIGRAEMMASGRVEKPLTARERKASTVRAGKVSTGRGETASTVRAGKVSTGHGETASTVRAGKVSTGRGEMSLTGRPASRGRSADRSSAASDRLAARRPARVSTGLKRHDRARLRRRPIPQSWSATATR